MLPQMKTKSILYEKEALKIAIIEELWHQQSNRNVNRYNRKIEAPIIEIESNREVPLLEHPY